MKKGNELLETFGRTYFNYPYYMLKLSLAAPAELWRPEQEPVVELGILSSKRDSGSVAELSVTIPKNPPNEPELRFKLEDTQMPRKCVNVVHLQPTFPEK